ncbi:Dabb family protein [Dokdonia sinensis]|uniref:Dabb family protein n=2 Tax=Dokdonia sinensis TaxID=2479847 RepID=A0A3M0G4U2_9FLAO|nr:Dabb family protein [Dokdonia sinensis]
MICFTVGCKDLSTNSTYAKDNTEIPKVLDEALQKRDANRTFNPNYAHVVYFWLNRPNNDQDRALFEKSLRTFLNNSAYAQTQFIGAPPKAVRDVVDDSFTYNLVVTFDSSASQVAYQEEEAHKKFVKEASHLWSKVIVYDATTIRD